MIACPCDSTQPYEECCQPYIEGQRLALTPEALMRSRYSAYTQAQIDYIVATMSGKAAEGFNPEDARRWAQDSDWVGLTVFHTQVKDDTGYVEFLARFRYQNRDERLYERSEFHRLEGRWFYVAGHPGKKISRNASCPCGSGLKAKRCCF